MSPDSEFYKKLVAAQQAELEQEAARAAVQEQQKLADNARQITEVAAREGKKSRIELARAIMRESGAAGLLEEYAVLFPFTLFYGSGSIYIPNKGREEERYDRTSGNYRSTVRNWIIPYTASEESDLIAGYWSGAKLFGLWAKGIVLEARTDGILVVAGKKPFSVYPETWRSNPDALRQPLEYAIQNPMSFKMETYTAEYHREPMDGR